MVAEALDAEFEGTVPAFALTQRGAYETALAEWAKDKGLSAEDVRDRWLLHFGDQIPGPDAAATEHLVEFVLEMRGPLDEQGLA
jgi:hypothetical protein